MIEILPQTNGNVVAMRVNGKLVHKDYQQFVPQLEAILQQYGTLRCYCELVNFQGLTWQALVDEMTFDMKHCNQIERCAIVGDASWNPWMTKFAQIVFGSARIQSFTPNQADQAWEWVSEQNEYATVGCGATHGTNANTNQNNPSYGNTTGSNQGKNKSTCGYTNTGTSGQGGTMDNTPCGQSN